jgi:hypothetical protein
MARVTVIFAALHLSECLKPPENMVNAEKWSVEGLVPMTDYSDSEYVPKIKSTVYGIDTAIVIVILASAAFWLSIGVAVWLFVG